jgi:hypothetical protein
MRQLAAFVERKVEQRRKHLSSQLDGYVIDPVERLAHRQRVENGLHARAYRAFERCEIARRHRRRNGFALYVVLRRVHRDEHRHDEVVGLIEQRDVGIGRKQLVVGVDALDIVEACQRPIRTVVAIAAIVHGRVTAQPFEIRPMRVVFEEMNVADVEVVERHRFGAFARALNRRFVIEAARTIVAHRFPLRLRRPLVSLTPS